MDQVITEYKAAINDSVIWSGVRNASGTTAASIATGFESLIATAISGSEITPISTSAITSSNAVTQVDAFVDGLPVWMLKKGVADSLLLRSIYELPHALPHTEHLQLRKEPLTDSTTDGFNNITLVPVSWLPKTSDRLIATVAGNMIFGTDNEQVQVHATMSHNIVNVRLMLPVGFQIADTAALFVNNQS